jgi:hypothetical protein
LYLRSRAWQVLWGWLCRGGNALAAAGAPASKSARWHTAAGAGLPSALPWPGSLPQHTHTHTLLRPPAGSVIKGWDLGVATMKKGEVSGAAQHAQRDAARPSLPTAAPSACLPGCRAARPSLRCLHAPTRKC